MRLLTLCAALCALACSADPGAPTGGDGGTDGAPARDAQAGCLHGRADCDGNPANGCEVDLTRDNANCGACGTRCQAPERCGPPGVCL